MEKVKFLFNDEMTINDCKISREEKRIEKFTLSLVRKVVKFWTFKSTSKWIELPSSDYAIPKDPFVASQPCILNDFLSDHVRRAWLRNSRSLVFEFIDKYRELLCRLTMVYRGFVSKRSCSPRFYTSSRSYQIFTRWFPQVYIRWIEIYLFTLFLISLFSDKRVFKKGINQLFRNRTTIYNLILWDILFEFTTILLSF